MKLIRRPLKAVSYGRPHQNSLHVCNDFEKDGNLALGAHTLKHMLFPSDMEPSGIDHLPTGNYYI